ncbi:MAG TPA: DUF4221 family protein [Cyclobacteriaceae bacterium]|nr:DUF4221 family protein [Cyclobacteriaceae bacterium]
MKVKFLTPLLFLILLASCGKNKKASTSGPDAIIELELVDSLVVNEPSTLAMDDYSPENGYYLIKGTRSRRLYLVDDKGTIIKEYDILNEGPNGVGSSGAFGYRFLDKDRWIAQGRPKGYHIFNLQGEKQKTVPHNTEELFSLKVYTFRTTFNPYVRNGTPYIVGEEPNLFNPGEHDPKKGDPSFYQQVRTVYNYNLDAEENELLETFPEAWQPRIDGKFVGTSLPFVAYHKKKRELALLPVIGDQLFVYDYSGDMPILKDTVELSHRFRPNDIPMIDPNEDPTLSDYPQFTDLRMFGDYILVGFHTKIPKEVIRELRAKSEEFYNLPEYKTAFEEYNKSYYLLVKGGKQIGILDEFPVHGSLNFIDENGYLYINDNLSPEVERDYNVFYKLRISE